MARNNTPLIIAGVVIAGLFIFKKEIGEFFGGFGKATQGLGSGIGEAGSGLGSGIGALGSEIGQTGSAIVDPFQAFSKGLTEQIDIGFSNLKSFQDFIAESQRNRLFDNSPKKIDTTPKVHTTFGGIAFTGNDPKTGLPLQEIGGQVFGKPVYGYSSKDIPSGVGATTSGSAPSRGKSILSSSGKITQKINPANPQQIQNLISAVSKALKTKKKI